jgi:hypothetical protein
VNVSAKFIHLSHPPELLRCLQMDATLIECRLSIVDAFKCMQRKATRELSSNEPGMCGARDLCAQTSGV